MSSKLEDYIGYHKIKKPSPTQQTQSGLSFVKVDSVPAPRRGIHAFNNTVTVMNPGRNLEKRMANNFRVTIKHEQYVT